MVKVDRYEDLIPLIDTVNYLEDQGLIGHPRYSCPMDSLCMMWEPEVYKPTPELLQLNNQPGGASVAEYQRYAQEHGLEYWNVLLNFYGPKKTVLANWEYAQEKFAAIAGARFEQLESYSLPIAKKDQQKLRHKTALGIPNMSIFSIGARSEAMPNPDDGHAWFAPIIPRNCEHFLKSHEVFCQAAKELGLTSAPIAPTNVPQTWQYRTYIYLFPFFISRSNKEQNQRAVEQFIKLVKIAAEHGWTEYRTAPIFQDLVASTYSFNDNALLRFQNLLKDAVDPNGIIAPGRAGIWPKRYREDA